MGRFAAIAAVALFIGFGTAVASALKRGLVNDCGCGGALHSTKVSWKLVARNAILAALTAIVAIFGPGQIAIDAVSTEFSWFMFAITAVLTCVATVMRLHYTRTPTINNQRG